jgi:mitotic spindle assembly checkpoint protein MAD1
MVRRVFRQRMLADTATHRANKSNEVGTPSEPSLSVIQSLSELRLTHARLLEEHGANIAILRSREAELARLTETLSEAQGSTVTLQGEVQALKDKVARREQRAQLAEREVGFLQALVVRANTWMQCHF